MIDKAAKDHDIIVEILRIMSGKEWSPDTLADVAQLLQRNGYMILDLPDDEPAL